MTDFSVVSATEEQMQCHLPFAVSLVIRRLSNCNFLAVVKFPYHNTVAFRITDINGAWLIFFNRNHFYSFLQRNGLNNLAVVHHD
ncbi:hypothetical protein [Rheinheimera sp.]|uniref:hypothetical protein n=1 Tax=Rheinheimera sp. TaxID=1869214 RepID=UPI002FDE1250